jgi:hypothetical protein
LLGLVVGLKKDGIMGNEKSAQPGFFIHHEFDQIVGMGNDLIGTVNPAITLLYLLESISQGHRQQGQSDDWKGDKAEQQTSVCGSFQKDSQGRSKRSLQFCLIRRSASNAGLPFKLGINDAGPTRTCFLPRWKGEGQ